MKHARMNKQKSCQEKLIAFDTLEITTANH